MDNVISYLEMNGVGLLFCILVFIQQNKTDKKIEIMGSNSFRAITLITMLTLVLDSLSRMIVGGVAINDTALHMVIRCLYYISLAYLAFELFRYCLKINKLYVKPKAYPLMLLPLLLTIAEMIVNQVRPFAFKVSEDVPFQRLWGFWIISVAPLIYVAVSFTLSLAHYIRASKKDKAVAYHFMMFCLWDIVGAILGILFDGFSLVLVIAAGIMYLFLFVQNKKEAEMESLAFNDSLTGLSNVTAYRRKVDEMDTKITDGLDAFSVVLLDVNGLKETNDVYGHDSGNQLLIAAGKLICNVFKGSTVYRIGGDEFLVILEDAVHESRYALIKKFDQEMSKCTFRMGNKFFPVSISRGIAEFSPDRGMNYVDVFRMADYAMYEDKKNKKEMKATAHG